ncbi:hypothetical protein ACFL4W_03830 [Planctomycetota bacterium]
MKTAAAVCVGLLMPLFCFAADGDGDGLEDAWEALYQNVFGGSGFDPAVDDRGNGRYDPDVDPDLDGVPNVLESNYSTDPADPDTDGDGYSDYIEVFTVYDPTDPLSKPLDGDDSDSDGLTNADELNVYHSDPGDDDTDGDGLDDYAEVITYGSDPNDRDTDNDLYNDFWETDNAYDPTDPMDKPGGPAGDTDADDIADSWEVNRYGGPEFCDPAADDDGDNLTNLEEFNAGTSPTDPDTDGDGIPDDWELANSLDPADAGDAALDGDSDNLTNLEEYGINTDPAIADTDGDSFQDDIDITPVDADADNDGMPDAWETTYFADATAGVPGDDGDSDGLNNLAEYQTGTVPTDDDTDGDLFLDGADATPMMKDTEPDGLDDDWEMVSFSDLDETAGGDPDGDGWTNIDEFQADTDPMNSNSYPEPPPAVGGGDGDQDGMLDDWEAAYFGDKADCAPGSDDDGDGVDNLAEYNLGTNPISSGSVPASSSSGGGGCFVSSGSSASIIWTAMLALAGMFLLPACTRRRG